MIEYFFFTFSYLIVLSSLYGYGVLIDKKKDIFFIFLSGYTIIGSIALVLHFFFPLSNTLSTIIISIGLLILLFKKISFKKIYLYYFIFFFICRLFIIRCL